MNIGIFKLYASKRLGDITITLYAVWKYPPITTSVNLFFPLAWMLTFEFTKPRLNMTHANIFHYPRLWISETAWVELNIYHDWHEHYTEVHAEEAGYRQHQRKMTGGEEAEMMDRYVISIFAAATSKHLLCATAEFLPLNWKFLNSLIW